MIIRKACIQLLLNYINIIRFNTQFVNNLHNGKYDNYCNFYGVMLIFYVVSHLCPHILYFYIAYSPMPT